MAKSQKEKRDMFASLIALKIMS